MWLRFCQWDGNWATLWKAEAILFPTLAVLGEVILHVHARVTSLLRSGSHSVDTSSHFLISGIDTMVLLLLWHLLTALISPSLALPKILQAFDDLYKEHLLKCLDCFLFPLRNTATHLIFRWGTGISRFNSGSKKSQMAKHWIRIKLSHFL